MINRSGHESRLNRLPYVTWSVTDGNRACTREGSVGLSAKME